MIADEEGILCTQSRGRACLRVDFDTSGRSRSQLPMTLAQQWIEDGRLGLGMGELLCDL